MGEPSGFWIRTTALLTVSATSTETNAPIRLRMPESATATFGRSAFVAMDVGAATGPVGPVAAVHQLSGVRTTVARPVCAGVPVSV